MGQGFCRGLLKRGYRVFATARKVETLKDLAAEGCDVLALDVADSQSIADAVQVVETTAGRLDFLINNAGVVAVAPLLDTDIKTLQYIIQINAVSQLEMIQAFSKLLVYTANDPKLGSRPTTILNIGSTAAGGSPWHGSYSLSKAASHALSEALRMEMKPLGVNVVSGHLSLVKSAMTDRQKTMNSFKEGTSTFYPNWSEIHAAHEKGFDGPREKAPLVEDTVRDYLDQIEGKKNPPRVVYGGLGGSLMRYAGIIPQWVFDKLFEPIGRWDLVQRPVSKDS